MDGERNSPYRGLVPYEEYDYPYFFGRQRDTDRVVANLKAWRFSILYGASGVGKTSILKAGVVAGLMRQAKQAVQDKSEADVIPIAFSNWKDDPRPALKTQVMDVLSEVYATAAPSPESQERPVGSFLEKLTDQLHCRFLLILDQFEEYFVYHGRDKGENTFSAELVQVVANPELSTHVLVSIREDSVTKLDRFKGKIPGLWDNHLRIEHLDQGSARQAIEKPILQWNREFEQAGKQVSIEAGLVDELLAQLSEMEKLEVGTRGARPGRGERSDQAVRIEAPLLQLVLQRLWDTDTHDGSGALQRSTLHSLGGAVRITRNHLERTLLLLTQRQREIAVTVFDRLITPSKTKIAQSISDLASYAREVNERFSEAEVEATMRKLAEPTVRVLRPVEPPLNQPDLSRYEIFHDALADPILDYVEKRRRARRSQRFWRRIALYAGAGLLIIAALLARAYLDWRSTRPWGFVEALWTGKTYPLKPGITGIGRTTKGYLQNDIDVKLPVPNDFRFQGNEISRGHLLIDATHRAMDLRSLNGTIVNGVVLPYGEGVLLQSRDLIVLAGGAPLRVHMADYAWYQFWTPGVSGTPPPPDAWGMLLDGSAKRVIYLNGTSEYLSLDETGGLRATVDARPDWLARIDLKPDGSTSIMDRQDDLTLVAEWKASDYSIVACELPAGEPVPAFSPRRGICRYVVEPPEHDRGLRGANLFDMALHYGETRFQIVPILRARG